ncbi:hypothetical protein LCGC14_2704290 [marine sediment metagenome]|uniref:Uncharacterized protein n=1 Tax=marine sediment metagenome TaxID=412755 RepID=A0A0F9C6M4_9ZZZZ
MEILQVAQQIEQKIRLLERGRTELEQLARNKANTIGEYIKKLEGTIITIKDSGNLPATLTPKVAEGQCWKERVAMELAGALYQVQIKKMESVQAELNGFQSINRYLDNK